MTAEEKIAKLQKKITIFKDALEFCAAHARPSIVQEVAFVALRKAYKT